MNIASDDYLIQIIIAKRYWNLAEFGINKVSTIGIAAENRFKAGHAPVVPTLNYLKNDPVVQGLIEYLLFQEAYLKP